MARKDFQRIVAEFKQRGLLASAIPTLIESAAVLSERMQQSYRRSEAVHAACRELRVSSITLGLAGSAVLVAEREGPG